VTVPPESSPAAAAEWFAGRASELAANMAGAVRGKPEVIRLALVGLFAEGHLLLEDVPGVGKTLLARAMAASVDATWHRIQFTPDLLPSDVTGVTIFNQGTRQFEFHPGPVFANIVLADEINRASPKTQAALLEVMEEQQVTVDSTTYPVARPFLVMATQNPIDMDGTYALPEAQLDRFLLRTSIGYPDHRAEMEILMARDGGSPVSHLRPVLSLAEVQRMVAVVHAIHAGEAVVDYIVRLVRATRDHPEVRLPVSPRGSVSLLRAARAVAASAGRSFVTPEDIKGLVVPVLAHRLILTPEAELAGRTPEDLLMQLTATVAVPQAAAR
jgi:MoxR-like ATPase